MESMPKAYVGVDVGGTSIKCGIVNEEGEVLASCRRPTAVREGQEAVIGRIADMVEEALASPAGSGVAAAAVGVGIPGLVDPKEGISRLAVNLGWKDVPVARLLEERLGLPVAIENDVRTYMYGEAIRGAGAGFGHVFGVTLGTGLASAYILDGTIFGGGGRLAGECGHIPHERIPYACNCGRVGCLETLVSATGIARQAADAVRGGAEGGLARFRSSPEAVTAKDVSDACAAGDAAALAIMAHTGRLLGEALSYIVPVLSPDVIVVGGGAAQAGDALLGPMERELRGRLLPAFADRLAIRPAALGSDAGIVGSAIYAKNRQEFA